MKAIGIDIGTTSICGNLIDISTGDVENSITCLYDAFCKTENTWERIQDPKIIYTKTIEILEKLICDDVISIGVTGQMHGILYLDKEGDPISLLYTWQDMRGDLPFKDTTYARFLGSSTGYGNVTHFYNKQNKLVPQGMSSFCTIGDYFAMKISGRKTPIMHNSNAASLGSFDAVSGEFDCDVPTETVGDCRIVGEYKGVPITVAIGDNQASIIGSGTIVGSALVNIGTGSQISVIVSESREVESSAELRPYVEGKFLLAGSALCGGRAYSALKDFYSDIILSLTGTVPTDLYANMEKMLQGETATTLNCNSQFAGSRKDPESRGSISNIGLDNFAAKDMTIGILSGIVTELHDIYEQNGMDKSTIKLIGAGNGVRKNKTLAKIIENTFSHKLNIPTCTEEAAYGAALFAAVGAGVFASVDEAQKIIKY